MTQVASYAEIDTERRGHIYFLTFLKYVSYRVKGLSFSGFQMLSVSFINCLNVKDLTVNVL